MRRPLRKPHGIETSDIENFETESKYIIYLDGTSYVAINGDTGAEDSRSASAHTVIQYAIDNGGAGEVTLKCDVTLTAGITGAADIIFNGNRHTITPSSSFDIFTITRPMCLENVTFDCSGLAFTDTVIDLVCDATHFHGNNAESVITCIRNCRGRSDSEQGIFLHVNGTAAAGEMFNLRVVDCSTDHFEYGFKLAATGAGSWINGNQFERLVGWGDKYFIHLDATGGSACNSNWFSYQYQTTAGTHTVLTIDDSYNYIQGQTFDLAGGDVGIAFTAASSYNYYLTGHCNLAYITDAGTDNTIYVMKDAGFVGKAPFNLFKETGANPFFRIYGNTAGGEVYAYMNVTAGGEFSILGESTNKLNIDGKADMYLSGSAGGDIYMFHSCDTDENRLLQIGGRNNADNAINYLQLRWGDGTHEDGEIISPVGDLRLNPAGVLRFGTRTATGDAVSNGYVTIKDSAGNTVKLMTTA